MADNPFLTDELLERRPVQRRRLRLIDAWLIDRVIESAASPPVPDDPTDRLMLERLVRDLADEEAAHLGDLLQRMEDHEAAVLLVPFLQGTWKTTGHLPQDTPMRPDVSTLVRHYEEQTGETKVDQVPDDPARSHLARLIAFSLWADKLADDRYHDRRPPQRRRGHRLKGVAASRELEDVRYSSIEFLRIHAGGTDFYSHIDDLFTTQVGANAALLGVADLLERWTAFHQSGMTAAIPFAAQARIEAATDLMEQVQLLLDDSQVHPAAPVMLAGAALEEFLRSMLAAHPEATVTGKPALNSYSQALAAAGVLSKQDVKDITSHGQRASHPGRRRSPPGPGCGVLADEEVDVVGHEPCPIGGRSPVSRWPWPDTATTPPTATSTCSAPRPGRDGPRPARRP